MKGRAIIAPAARPLPRSLAMFWPFTDARGRLEYCPLADFGGVGLCEGADISGRVVIAEPVTAHEELRNASDLAGCVVLVQRGQCDFVSKALRAQRAGAIGVLVANLPSDSAESDDDAAFVMDAGSPGRHSPAELAEIRIPAMMMSFNLAVFVFKQTRAATLEHKPFMLTVKLLGAQRAAWVLEQRERMNSSLAAVTKQMDAAQRQEQRERRQREATKVLRGRFDGLGGSSLSLSDCKRSHSSTKTASVRGVQRASRLDTGRSASVTSDVVSDIVSVASEAFTEPLTTRMRRWELETDHFTFTDNNFDDEVGTSNSCSSGSGHKYSHSSTGSVSSVFRSTFQDIEAASGSAEEERPLAESVADNQSLSMGPMLHPLCPMTTALVIIDVQNQFVHHGPDSRHSSHQRERRHQRHDASSVSSSKTSRFRYAVENELLPTIQDVLLASRVCEGIEIVYSIVESATRDGRERSPVYKRAGIHVTRNGFGAQIPALIAPDMDHDFVLPRPGIKWVWPCPLVDVKMVSNFGCGRCWQRV